MELMSDAELIRRKWLCRKCCCCGTILGYVEAGRDLKEGDLLVSHTYCESCYDEAMNDIELAREGVV
jgi:hypothetical protein